MAAAKDQDIVDRLTGITEDAPYGPWMLVTPTRQRFDTGKGYTPTKQHQKSMTLATNSSLSFPTQIVGLVVPLPPIEHHATITEHSQVVQTRLDQVSNLKSHLPDHDLKGDAGSVVDTLTNDMDMAEASTKDIEAQHLPGSTLERAWRTFWKELIEVLQ
ncbi:hypothetical protein M9H77_26162 [Catharanthus roseus]|uniref:Uncharacterized protein n=1 Tax=Catharanthus roseus TaxID=4058 RepID=A0ACC0A968_CATRO|nr:hypothetical protein M9H77_26162 [Catharanthus roseus]